MRVPSYYCPHCGRFKKLFQVEWCEYSLNFYCRHCGNKIIETEEFFLKIIEMPNKVAEALEKQIPKKPIKNEWDYTCPTCGQKQIDDDEDVNLYYPHCFNCGQRLDWGDI